jgi:hypothetical protein
VAGNTEGLQLSGKEQREITLMRHDVVHYGGRLEPTLEQAYIAQRALAELVSAKALPSSCLVQLYDPLPPLGFI